jgi:hypothetical protein
MSAVMMIPINAAKTRVPGKGLLVADRLVPMLAVAPLAKRKTVAAVLLAKSEAMIVVATVTVQSDSPWRTVSRAPGDDTGKAGSRRYQR